MSAELDIINAMLRTIGEYARDTDIDSHPDVADARNIIEEQRRAFLGEGYWFNTPTMKLSPTVNNEIFIPNTTLSVDAVDSSRNVSMRGDQLYDEDNQTLVFTSPIDVQLVLDVTDLDDIPYIALMVIKWNSVIEFAAVNQVTGIPVDNAMASLRKAEDKLTAERYRKADINWNNTPMAQRMFEFRTKFGTTRKRGASGAGYSRLRKTLV